jgi:3-mercaptopyruvate sulfurtransferase SseA
VLGGFKAWQEAGGPVEPGAPKPSADPRRK